MKKELESSGRYSLLFKKKIISEVLSSDISFRAISRKYNIGGRETVSNWLKKVQIQEVPKKELSLLIMKEKSTNGKEVKTLGLKEVEALEEQLKQALLQAEAYKTLLEIGKDEYGIDLEKKLGAK